MDMTHRTFGTERTLPNISRNLEEKRPLVRSRQRSENLEIWCDGVDWVYLAQDRV
jgi:hypothetical protein